MAAKDPLKDYADCVKTTCAGFTGDALTHCIDGCAKVVVGNIFEESSKALQAQIASLLQASDKAAKAQIASVLDAAMKDIRKIPG